MLESGNIVGDAANLIARGNVWVKVDIYGRGNIGESVDVHVQD
jgi:hypothetical protein